MRLLKHPPHRIDILWCPAPVSDDSDVSKQQIFLVTGCSTRGVLNDFLCHEALGTQRRFVIVENSGASMQFISFTIRRNQVMCCCFSDRIRALGSKRSVLSSGDISGIAETLAGTGIVISRGTAQKADRFQHVERTHNNTVYCFDRLAERQAY